MKRSRKQARHVREQKWIAALAIRQKFIKQEDNIGDKGTFAYACATCNQARPSGGLKFIEDGPGVVIHRRTGVLYRDEIPLHCLTWSYKIDAYLFFNIGI